MRLVAGVFKESSVERGVNLPQLDDRRFDTAFLLLEHFDLLHALLACELQAAAAVPVLLQSLDDPDPSTQRFQTISAWGLINTHPGTLLLPPPSLRPRAIRALGLIREDAPVVVPVLVRHIQSDTNWVSLVRGNYCWALACFGTNAESAVPVLVHLLQENP